MNSAETTLRDQMREFYETSQAYKNLLDAHDRNYLKTFVDLVDQNTPRDGKTLEIGCGNGIASKMLHERDRDVVGTDISPLFLEDAKSWENDRLRYKVCDALALDFGAETFDVVCSNELIEHVPDVEQALREMMRIVRKGGRIVISGPNLCSPLMPFLDLLRMIAGGEGRPIWAETKWCALQTFFRNVSLYFRKRLTSSPNFLYRSPDLEDQIIGGDADSAYLASPIDLEQFFSKNDLRIVRRCVGFGWKGKIMAKFAPRISLHISMVIEK